MFGLTLYRVNKSKTSDGLGCKYVTLVVSGKPTVHLLIA